MAKIQKVSRYLLILSNTLLFLFPLLVIFEWLFIDTDLVRNLLNQGLLQAPVSTPEGYINLGTIHWTILSKILGLISQSLNLLPLFLSVFVLKSIFQNYQKGEIFSSVNAYHYRSLGGLFFLDALLTQPLSDLLMVLAVTISNAPGHRYMSITFGTPNLEALFCGTLVIVISWIMLEASKLHDEQKFTI